MGDAARQAPLGEKGHIGHRSGVAFHQLFQANGGGPGPQAVGGGQEHAAGLEQLPDAGQGGGQVGQIEQHIKGGHRVKAPWLQTGVEEVGVGDFHVGGPLLPGLFQGGVHHLWGDVDSADVRHPGGHAEGDKPRAAGEFQYPVCGLQVLQGAPRCFVIGFGINFA